ncbi:MAG: AI-2E family transporter [Halobacteria archaeon]|nr:AI-2E family transporter [Halobacteria archaeon]
MDDRVPGNDRTDLVLSLLGLLLFGLVVYSAYRFIASITFAVFLYYSSRPIYRRLKRVGFLGRRARVFGCFRAVITLFIFAIPFVALLVYTVLLTISEAAVFVERYPVDASVVELITRLTGVSDLPELSIQGLRSAYESGNYRDILEALRSQVSGVLGFLGNFLLGFFIMVAATYYLLVDGHRLKEWLLQNYDRDGVLRRYFESVDEDLSVILFGNILNAFLTAVIGIIVYNTYNVFAPSPADVPYASLVGALTGAGSLVPIVGMKIVYFPVAALMTAGILVLGQTTALVYVVGFVAVSFVVVDLVPDFILRPFVSGRGNHIGLLTFAYVFGPFVFGFYGIFLGPIVLVLFINFVHDVLPHLVGDENQGRIDDFSD